MRSTTTSPTHSSAKYVNPRIDSLIMEMGQYSDLQQQKIKKKISADQKIRYSQSVKTSRRLKMQKRPEFKHNTKEGQLIDADLRSNPYMFIPGFKNNTFIMPNRVFEKGAAGKRFFIKMKDSSIFSFRDSEPERALKAIHRERKQETILSRQNEQYNRIIKANDGRVKAEFMKHYLKTRKRTNPAVHASQFFSEYDPMLEPKDPEIMHAKKVSLSKTYEFHNTWRPFTRGNEVFSATVSNSFRSHPHHTASLR